MFFSFFLFIEDLSSDAGSVKSDSCIDYCTNHQQKASCSKNNFEKVESNSHNTSSTKINAKDFSFTACETKYYEHHKSNGIAHRKINSDS